jgi:FAD/FMN-containing dehydrogenase
MAAEEVTPNASGEGIVAELEKALTGDVIRPGDESYDEARKIWNGAHDQRPALIVRCAETADAVRAVEFARSEGLLVAVRGGGHSIPGFSTCDDGIVIDLSPMKSVDVEPDARTARAGGGVTWGEFDSATQAHGLATTGGLVSTTGLGGFTTGGGVGWLMRAHGLACDNLLSADVVTADGQVVTASADEDSDLYWGIRGGGGNFGILTSLEYRLHPVGPTVAAGPIFHPGDRVRGVLGFFREFVEGVPDELTLLAIALTAPPAPFLPEEWHGKRLVALIGCYAGEVEAGLDAMQPMRELGDPVADLIGEMPYVDMQSLVDALYPRGTRAYMKAGYLSALDDRAIETVARHHQSAAPAAEIHIHQFGGAVARVEDEATAYGDRRSPYILNVIALAHEPEGWDDDVEWARRLYTDMEPSLTGGTYINYLSAEGADRVRAAYGDEKFARLQALKDRYDPTNLFRLNQNIPPSGV